MVSAQRYFGMKVLRTKEGGHVNGQWEMDYSPLVEFLEPPHMFLSQLSSGRVGGLDVLGGVTMLPCCSSIFSFLKSLTHVFSTKS
jgi:hypothetical protein